LKLQKLLVGHLKFLCSSETFLEKFPKGPLGSWKSHGEMNRAIKKLGVCLNYDLVMKSLWEANSEIGNFSFDGIGMVYSLHYKSDSSGRQPDLLYDCWP